MSESVVEVGAEDIDKSGGRCGLTVMNDNIMKTFGKNKTIGH
jgi:hypothetical protein